MFEIESSWAGYHVNSGLLDVYGRSQYSALTEAMLDGIRTRFGRPIALLAPTEPKYRSMLEHEFACSVDNPPSALDMRATTGFDLVLGPTQFADHVARRNGRSDYLLYVRSSDPIETLRSASAEAVAHPLLADASLRRTIRGATLTVNIDAPDLPKDDPCRINDSKAYLPALGLGSLVTSEAELAEVHAALGPGPLRVKPMRGAYGCYGHLVGELADGRFRKAFRAGLRRWGSFIVQREIAAPRIDNSTDGCRYVFMDRVFVGVVDGRRQFFGGHRLYLPADGVEAWRGRLHVGPDTVFATIDAELASDTGASVGTVPAGSAVCGDIDGHKGINR